MLTIKLKIKNPTKHKREKLLTYCGEFRACTNFWLSKIKELKTTSRTKLHKNFYQEAKSLFNLPTANIQVALDKAIETYRSYRAKKGKKSFPQINSTFGVFRKDTVKASPTAIRLSLNGGRYWFPVNIPKRYKKLIMTPICRSEIKFTKNHWYIYLTVQEKTPPIRKVNDILGIDLGIARLAVLSNLSGSINIFFKGEAVRAKRNFFAQKRAQLQRKKDNGSKNAYKALKRLSGKEKRWMKDLNHKISRKIVDIAKQLNCGLAVENLRGIRQRIKTSKKNRRMLHNWNFRQLINFIEYKAKLAGIPLVAVDPRGTSTTCLKCGSFNRRSRKSQSIFKCRFCGYTLNADLVGARNIARIASPSFGHTLKDRGEVARPNVALSYNLASFHLGSPTL